MHLTSISNVLGKLLIITGLSMVFPVIVSIYYGEDDLNSFLLSALITVLIGLPMWWFFRRSEELATRDGIFIAFFGWVLVSAVSALPFIIHESIPSFTDAFFEMMSGYTTRRTCWAAWVF